MSLSVRDEEIYYGLSGMTGPGLGGGIVRMNAAASDVTWWYPDGTNVDFSKAFVEMSVTSNSYQLMDLHDIETLPDGNELFVSLIFRFWAPDKNNKDIWWWAVGFATLPLDSSGNIATSATLTIQTVVGKDGRVESIPPPLNFKFDVDGVLYYGYSGAVYMLDTRTPSPTTVYTSLVDSYSFPVDQIVDLEIGYVSNSNTNYLHYVGFSYPRTGMLAVETDQPPIYAQYAVALGLTLGKNYAVSSNNPAIRIV